MKYIHLFQTEQQFNGVYNSADYLEPWLSVVRGSGDAPLRVDYNNKSYDKYHWEPFTVIAMESGTMTLPTPDGYYFLHVCEYSINGGGMDRF